MSKQVRTYLSLLEKVLTSGEKRQDRTKVGTLSLFGEQMRYDLQAGFPLLTTKKLHFKSIAHELIWFLKGDTQLNYLHQHNISIWDEWANEKGELGPIYGAQWRRWPTANGQTIDQIQQVIEHLREQPHSRRHLVSAWNVSELKNMALPPCHVLFQFFVSKNKYLSCQLYQRSADLFLGIPFNIASYALLTHLIAHLTHLKAHTLIHTLGDVHLYLNHTQQAKQQLKRHTQTLPTLQLSNSLHHLENLDFSHIQLSNYHPHPPIPAPIAI